MKDNKDKVNKYAACSRCANNGCKFCTKCDGYFYWKLLPADPVVFNDEKKKKREYAKQYFQEHKAEINEKRRSYLLNYYHEVIKNNPDEMAKRRARGNKYYWEHHDEIRAKRNAKKKADLLDPAKGDKMRKEHTEYMRGYRSKKKETQKEN